MACNNLVISNLNTKQVLAINNLCRNKLLKLRQLLLAGPVLAVKLVTLVNSVLTVAVLNPNLNRLLALGNALAVPKTLANSVLTAAILNLLLKKAGPAPAAL